MQVRYSLVKPQLPEFICTDEPICAISPFKPSGKEVGGGGYSTNVYTGRLLPEVQPLTFFYISFHEEVFLSYTFY